MNFLGAVNRVLVNNTVIKGDDDLLTSFGDNQHEATLRFARQAITTELNNITSFFSFPLEKATATITTVAGTRVYSLEADFVQFYLDNPFFYLNSDYSSRLYEYPGGENKLRQHYYLYLTDQGYESSWYWVDATNKSVAFHQVPDTSNRVWNYEYEKNVGVSVAGDDLPFQTEQEAEAFSDMASRRYKYLVSKKMNVSDLELDADYVFNRSTLMNLLRVKNPRRRYGRRYR